MSNSPQTINHTESNQLLHYLTDYPGFRHSKPLNLRNLCMALFMLDAGLRVSEVSTLLWTDCFVNDVPVNSLFLDAQVTKTKTSRTVPLSERLKKTLLAYYQAWQWPISGGVSPWLFCGDHPKNYITSRQIERMIKRASLAAFGRAIHPHILRHTFATRLMRKVNARIVQELLGHRNLASTQIYSHPNNDDLTEAIKLIE